MIGDIQDVYYNVSNMKLSVSFYENVLGFKKVHGDEYWTSLEKNGFNLGLHWTEGESVPAVAKDSHGAHAGATITLKSTDIPEDRKVLEANNCNILGEADAAWGHMLIFEDPDGNVLKLMKPKY